MSEPRRTWTVGALLPLALLLASATATAQLPATDPSPAPAAPSVPGATGVDAQAGQALIDPRPLPADATPAVAPPALAPPVEAGAANAALAASSAGEAAPGLQSFPLPAQPGPATAAAVDPVTTGASAAAPAASPSAPTPPADLLSSAATADPAPGAMSAQVANAPTSSAVPAPSGAAPPAVATPAAPTAATFAAAAPDAGIPGSPNFVGPPALIAEGDASSPRFIGPPLVPPLKLLGSQVLPGSKKQLRWSASQSFAGGDSVAPVNVVHGSRPGPVLCLISAIHGDEINGVEIVRRLINQANPDRLSGSLIGVPIVNLFGFSRNSRYLPDRRDLNRFFPGSKRGSIASRIADSFFNQVARHCGAIVDFHTGSFDRANLPQVRADLRMPDVLRFSRGFGELPVLHSDGTRGMLRVAATQIGIPAVTFEVGAPGTLEPAEIETAVIAIEALMHYLGMTPESPGEQEPQAIFYDSLWVRANGGGMLISQVELGERVTKGQRLGVVIDPIKNIERQILSPVYGRVIGKARNQVVLPGFAAFHLGEETSAEEASDAAAEGRTDETVEEDPDPESERDAAY